MQDKTKLDDVEGGRYSYAETETNWETGIFCCANVIMVTLLFPNMFNVFLVGSMATASHISFGRIYLFKLVMVGLQVFNEV